MRLVRTCKRKLCSYVLNKRFDIENIKTFSQIRGPIIINALPVEQFLFTLLN